MLELSNTESNRSIMVRGMETQTIGSVAYDKPHENAVISKVPV